MSAALHCSTVIDNKGGTSVSMDLLMPVLVYDQNGYTLPQLYVFNQGDVAFFGSHHLPYTFLALFFLLTFTLLV